MTFSAYHSTGKISKPAELSTQSFATRSKTPSAGTTYLELLGCEIQEARGEKEQSGISNFSYFIYFPMDDPNGNGKVKFKTISMSMRAYLSRTDKVDIKEGHIFEGTVDGKAISGVIKFYLPNQLGCKLAIIDIDV